MSASGFLKVDSSDHLGAVFYSLLGMEGALNNIL